MNSELCCLFIIETVGVISDDCGMGLRLSFRYYPVQLKLGDPFWLKCFYGFLVAGIRIIDM